MMKLKGSPKDPAVAKATADQMAKLNDLPAPKLMLDTFFTETALSRCYVVAEEETSADVVYENDGNTVQRVINFAGRFKSMEKTV